MDKKPKKYWPLGIYLVLALVTLAAFWQLRHHNFVTFDDDLYIYNNHHIKTGLNRENIYWAFTNVHAGGWHPLTTISHMLDCELYGLDPGAHHFTNLLLHTANAILLLLLLNRMTKNFWASAFIAAAFAIHPLHVESVAWASERKDVLSTFFWILTLLAYLRYVERPCISRYLLVLLNFVLGLMSKSMLVTLPFVLLLLDHWPFGRFKFGKNVKDNAAKWRHLYRLVYEKIPIFLLSAASCVITFLVERDFGVMNVTECPLIYRVGNAMVSYVVYIQKMFWPTQLAIFYPHKYDNLPLWQILGAFLLLVIITIVILRLKRNYPYLVIGWLWFLGILVPVIGLIQVGDQALADRYTYIPLTGLFIIITFGLTDLLNHLHYRKAILSLTATMVLSVLAIITWHQVRHWRNSLTLYKHATEVVRNNWWAHNNLGISLSKKGNLDKAVYHFNKAIDIKPKYFRAHNNLGNSFKLQGRFDEAVSQYQQALELNPFYIEARNNLAILLSEQNKLDDALEHFQKSLLLKPDHPLALNGTARILATHTNPKKRDLSKAITFAEKAALLTKYQNPIILNTLATAYAAAGQFDQAIIAAQLALELANTAQNHNLADYIHRQMELYRKAKPEHP